MARYHISMLLVLFYFLFPIIPVISGFQAFWSPGSFSLGFFKRVMNDFSTAALHCEGDNFKWLATYPQTHMYTFWNFSEVKEMCS